ncbi:peptidoglycan/LPS O-acetylase OafA/YrhL [Nitrobacter vulgaris]|uniref:hypothetical protein n=1 Tax=Nitrobacter vulgaris TaxID=29421 RepID=UPI002858B877|nr:hypothetical protein [Nitrobacter vulgaris]MDR6306133.1 peptidoglycan/LPS O-acetylase OafA/YrhL [Nitrobacter vulgaris]
MLWKIRLVQQIQTAPSRLPALDLLRLAAVAGIILYHYVFWAPIRTARTWWRFRS